MTTGTGAVGYEYLSNFNACADQANSLNLTIATQVHILEPQWNPSIESQAIGRALRLTQKNVVTVTRYITENTIEEVFYSTSKKKFDFKTENGTASSR
jgi:SNF2 family DNA or RNA helicase